MNSFSVLAEPNASISKSGLACAAAAICGQWRVDALLGLLGVTGELVVDQHRMPVGRDRGAAVGVRTLEVLDALRAAQALRHVVDRALELRVAGLELLALDEDRLLGLLGKRVVDRDVGAAGLADAATAPW